MELEQERPSSATVRSDIQLGFEGRVAVADALDRITSLTSVNGCNQYAAIRKGELAELKLHGEWELAVAVARYLPRSGSTLRRLDVRCVALECRVWGRNGGRLDARHCYARACSVRTCIVLLEWLVGLAGRQHRTRSVVGLVSFNHNR